MKRGGGGLEEGWRWDGGKWMVDDGMAQKQTGGSKNGGWVCRVVEAETIGLLEAKASLCPTPVS